MRTPGAPRVAKTLVGLAVGALLLWLVSKRVDLGALSAQLARVPAWALAAALSFLALNLVLYAARWRVLLRAAGSDVPARRLLSAIVVANGANTVLPARGGDLVRVEAVRERFGVRPAHAIGTLFLERLLDGIVLATFLAAAVLALPLHAALLVASLLLLGAVALGVVLTLAAALRPTWATATLSRATARLPERSRGAVDRSAEAFLYGLSAFGELSAFARALSISFLMWLPQVGMYFVVGHGFGLDLPLAAYFAIVSLANLALSLPLAPAGIGSYEAAAALTAVSLGGEGAAGLVGAYVVVMRGVSFLLPLVGAALLLPTTVPRLFGRANGATGRPSGEPAPGAMRSASALTRRERAVVSAGRRTHG